MVRVHVAEWSAPTRKERVVILFATHLITLLALFVWAVGPSSTVRSASSTGAYARAPIVIVSTGRTAPDAVMTLVTPTPVLPAR